MDTNANIREKSYDGTKCPYCEGDSIHPSNKIKYTGGIRYYQYVRCNDCNKIWKEVLEIVKFTPKDKSIMSPTEFEDLFGTV